MRSTRILIVEDDPALRLLLRRALAHHGFSTTTVASGEEALQSAWTEQPRVAIVDYMLPGMTGAELMQRLQQSLGDGAPTALLVTGTPESVSEEERALFWGVLAKPFRIPTLVHLVDKLADAGHGRARSGLVARPGVDPLDRTGEDS